MLFEFVQNNFVVMATTLFLILFILTNNNFEQRTNALFLAAACCVLVLIFTESAEIKLAQSETYEPMRVVFSAIGYSLRPMISYFLVIMVKSYDGLKFTLMTVPLLLNILIAFSALFCPLAFGYTQDNAFVRGPLGYTPFLVAGFYVMILLVQTIRACGNEARVEARIVSAIVLLAFLSTVMESLFHFRYIQNPSIATSITFYYLFLHSNRNNRDALTGALTRRRFYLDAEKNNAALTAVLSLDVNDLKTLNDQYGHVEGDRALTAVTDIIKKHTGRRAVLYRTGGDEFMVLCYKMSEGQVQAMIDGIRGDLQKTPYRCAIGYVLNDCRVDFDAVCQMADKAMYENKRQMKDVSKAHKMPAQHPFCL